MSTVVVVRLVGVWVMVFTVSVMAGNSTRKACTNNTKGICVKLENYYCPIGYHIANSGCAFREVCCFPFVQSLPTFEYGKDQCGVTSGNPKTRIVGGKATSVLYYPWMVSVQKFGNPICGGSIIADRWILTAAHCVVENTDVITVVAGSSSSHLSLSRYFKRHQVHAIVRHNKFRKGHASDGYDIALIKLSKPLDVGRTLTRKVCLPDTQETFENSICVATGWGYIHEPKNAKDAVSRGGSSSLRQANLPLWKKSLCRYYLGHLKPNTLCAGYRSGGEDTCQGDSGGPLVCKDKAGYWKQAGIVSVGKGCARKKSMGVYTEVAGFRKWIDYVIKKF